MSSPSSRYYWLLVIFLFMLCSGGGWWFRFCRSSSSSRSSHPSRTPTPGNPSRYSHSHPHPSNGITSHSLHSSTSNLRASQSRAQHHRHHYQQCPHHQQWWQQQQQQRARILHRPCGQRNSMYYLQRIWKSKDSCLDSNLIGFQLARSLSLPVRFGRSP